jgi:RHH-type proline utilization regulon transcriptional repressor/proline dehydrogenase/delta 1-pyrroline-5-carboxylate dehydrogenase
MCGMPEGSALAPDPHRAAIRRLHRAPDDAVLAPLLALATLPPEAAARVRARAIALVEGARRAHKPGADVSAFLAEFGLGTREGVALLCLAEALLRIPDAATADRLIEDKLAGADWQRHLGQADSMLVNASAFAFMLTGRVLSPAADAPMLSRTVKRLGEPVIRAALRQGMKVLAGQFVMGRTIGEALKRANESAEARRARYSFDMLGEAARTMADADRYMASYRDAIGAVGAAGGGRGPIAGNGVSVKLSALHPRYEPTKPDCVPALIASLTALAHAAKAGGIGLTVDAEEADRLDLSLDIIAAVHGDPALAGWDGLGMAVQGYQKRCLPLIDWAASLAMRNGRPIPVRLVKGAYWDSEVKHAQIQGRADYPVFTRKAATDVSWLACARRMFEASPHIQPAFATHNATSLAFILETAEGRMFEMQRLHGMGEALYAGTDCPVRVYAPVGGHEDLLAYLVRRLLENGANTGFVHRLTDPDVPAEALAEDPVAAIAHRAPRNARIPLPRDLYGAWRNSAGLDLGDPVEGPPALAAIRAAASRAVDAAPLIGSRRIAGPRVDVRDPADNRRTIGTVTWADAAMVDEAARLAARSWRAWNDTGAEHRAGVLERAADLIEANREVLLALIAREAGRTLADGIAEVREAADFCRYYAHQARQWFGTPRELPGPTGERNTWVLSGRGVIAAISPWNFPLAIFVGQVAAALAAGNAVLAKPAEQTPLTGARAIALLHEAGVPPDVLAFLPGDGPGVGAAMVAHPAVSGVAFTGGTETARAIAAAIVARPGLPIPLVAETGGINAMIVDSSALPEQVTADVLEGAFRSAGQRCSALRLLCLQEDTADRVLAMIEGAARTLTLGDPLDPATDIGPVIDAEAQRMLSGWSPPQGRTLFALDLPPACAHGTFVAPRAIALPNARALDREVFGPVLHVVRWREDGLDALCDDLAATGFALTLGVHSRVQATAERITARLAVGNTYINRAQIGAVPGVQPFGGHGLSGTGPKAGGPLALLRFATEHVVSVNTAAAGGNAALLATDEA